MQHPDHAGLGPHQGIGIVFHLMSPEIVGDETVDLGELAREQAHQIDHVYALIQQNAASGDLPIGAPIGRLAVTDEFGLPVDATPNSPLCTTSSASRTESW